MGAQHAGAHSWCTHRCNAASAEPELHRCQSRLGPAHHLGQGTWGTQRGQEVLGLLGYHLGHDSPPNPFTAPAACCAPAPQLELVPLDNFSAAAQCRAAAGFWRVLLGLLAPAVLIARPASPPLPAGARSRRPPAVWWKMPWSCTTRLAALIEEGLCLLHPPLPDPRLPREALLMSVLVAVPWLLRWVILLVLLWAGTLLVFRERLPGS